MRAATLVLVLAGAAMAAPPTLSVATGPAPAGRAGYAAAPAASGFTVLGKAVPATAQTELRGVLAGRRLCVLFACAEPAMARLKTTVKQPDGPVYEDDCVELFLAPVADQPDDYYRSW